MFATLKNTEADNGGSSLQDWQDLKQIISFLGDLGISLLGIQSLNTHGVISFIILVLAPANDGSAL